MFESGDQDYESVTGWDPVREERERLIAEEKKAFPRRFAPEPSMLWVHSAQYYIDTLPEMGVKRRLFGPFWLQDEMAILFAPPGVGKSVLATQLAESLARGVPLAPFDKQPWPVMPPQRVLYVDFELDRYQFRQRYATTAANGVDLENKYQLSPNLLRAEMYWDGKVIESYEDYSDMLFVDIANQIFEHEATVLILDNITFLTRGSTAGSTVAFRMMERLVKLKRGSDVSILVIAHTPKRPRPGPLTENDLQGSVDIAKVADSIFAVGRSRISSDLRYIKHLKCRTGRIENGEQNVAVFRLAKCDLAKQVNPAAETKGVDNFLGFDFVEFADEEDHLLGVNANTRRGPKLDLRLIRRARTLAAKGLSAAAIAKELGVPKTSAYRYARLA